MHILHFCAFLGREVKDWFTEIYTGQLAQHGGRRGYRGQCFDERCGGSGYYTLAMSVPMAVNTLYSVFLIDTLLWENRPLFILKCYEKQI